MIGCEISLWSEGVREEHQVPHSVQTSDNQCMPCCSSPDKQLAHCVTHVHNTPAVPEPSHFVVNLPVLWSSRLSVRGKCRVGLGAKLTDELGPVVVATHQTHSSIQRWSAQLEARVSKPAPWVHSSYSHPMLQCSNVASCASSQLQCTLGLGVSPTLPRTHLG